MDTTFTIQLLIEPEREGSYFTLPFTLPAGTEVLRLAYHYERYSESKSPAANGSFSARKEANIIDLGLIAPDGTQVGASGSDKTEITISETRATPGYRPCVLVPGEWQILVGAYKVAPGGVRVRYELTLTPKSRRWLRGDLHTHTLASDGLLTVPELGQRALRHGLNFLAITDHNQMVSAEALPQLAGITLIPGIEWTHYQGHANFLGVAQPYDAPFFTHTLAEARSRFDSARARGALVVVNHPFDENCPFRLDLNALPFDCLEVWNGPMRESNLRAVGFWHSLLAAGKKVPICGGSDFHRDALFLYPGGPTTCVAALSDGVSDILSALREGHAYITFAPQGPALELTAGEAILGDSVAWSQTQELQVTADGLEPGDVVRVITADNNLALVEAPSAGRFQGTYRMSAPGFARVEILRPFLPGLPLLPALISNPIYFEDR